MNQEINSTLPIGWAKKAGYLCIFSTSFFLSFFGTSGHGQDNGLAPEVTDLNAEDVSFQLEKNISYLDEPYLSSNPKFLDDGLLTGNLNGNDRRKQIVMAYAKELAKKSKDPKTGKTDSLLIAYRGKLIFESYFRRGRINYPHYQMSITKSYTALALGRAMQLGYLKMEDLDRSAISFLPKVNPKTIVNGAESITIHQALNMSSGIRIPKDTVAKLRKSPSRLKGQGQIQTYLEYSKPIPTAPRGFKYQASDPAIVMQVIESAVPGSAQDFIKNELLRPLGIDSYNWQPDISGLPKSAAGASIRSRDMLKFGLLVLNKGKWNGKQLIPVRFIEKATQSIKRTAGVSSYGYFWWSQSFEVAGKTYRGVQGRGAGGQFIFIFPELDLVVVATAHNQGMGNMLKNLPPRLIPAFHKSKSKTK